MDFNETKEINERQTAFYDIKRKNFATKLWFSLRNGLLQNVRRSIGVENDINQLHLSWLGDLSNKKVLDLGCYAGNSLSMHLALNSKEYIGVDLSERGISSLRRKIKNIPHARAITIDFLSEEFSEKDFDLIYAYGVLHHFKDVRSLISVLNQKLITGGILISYDPLETSFPIKFIRTLYRPFQSDREWEWPFSRKVYYQFEKAFKIKERRAMLGKAKWIFIINFLPLSRDKKSKIAKQWHREDWEKSKNSDSYMFSCMHLTMLMQKRE